MNTFSQADKFSLTDEALLEMLKHDHDWALKEIFTRYNFRLFRLAAGVLHDEDLAKDIVQDVFLDLWDRRHSSNIHSLSRYLLRAVKFQVLKQIRNGKLKDHHLHLVSNIRFANQTEESINHKELQDILEKAVNELSPRCKEIFVLSRFDNLSHKEISSRLNISTKTIECQISKALLFLREKLQRIMLLALMLLYQ